MKKRFYKDSYQRGFNTRDDAEDIPFESCQSLVNARPGSPSPSPREGIIQWGGDDVTEGVRWSFPFKTFGENYLIFISDDGIYYRTDSVNKTLIVTDAQLPAVGQFTGVRVKDSLFILTDDASRPGWIVTLDGSGFVARRTNIARPPITLAAVSDGGTGTSIPAGKFVSLAVTLVNRDDDAAFDGPGLTNPKLCDLDTIGFAAGLLETIDDIDDRITYENTSGVVKDVDITVTINNVAALDAQASHIRLYVTDPQTTVEAAEGAEHKWFADLPLTGTNATGVPAVPGPVDPYEYTLTFDEGQLAGALDTLKVVGYDALPACRYGAYVQGRLWLGSADTSGDGIGRWYYSEIPLDLDSPLKWASMFQLGTYFKDTSLDNTDLGQGLGISTNDLVFVMTASVWTLRDGDPDFEPQMVDAHNGTPFPNTITQIGGLCGYVGNFGPVTIEGRQAVPMEEFSAGEVWPVARDKRPGYFFTLADKSKVRGFFFRETFFIADEVKIIGMYMPGSGNGRGPWEIQPATPDIRIGHVNVFDKDTCVIVAGVSELDPLFYQLLVEDEHQDVGENFFLKSRSMAFLFDIRNRDQAGELYDMYMNASFTDAGRLDITVISNYFRYRWDGTYDETPATDDLTDESIDPSWRKVLQIGFPEGLVGFVFEVEWVKEYATPFDFETSGFTLRAKPVQGHPVEHVSRDLGSGPLENGKDIDFWYAFDFNVLTEPDEGPAARSLTYEDVDGAAARTYLSTLVPSGGVSLTGALNASGYRGATWSGLPPFGSRGFTREYVVTAAALSRTVWLELAGDGTYFFGVKITALGALVAVIYSATVKATYSTAAAVLPVAPAAGEDYTVQLTVSADMLTCRFYVARRTGAYTALPAPTSAVLAAGGPGIYQPGGINGSYLDTFAALNPAVWTGGTVAGGRLTSSATWSYSALTLAAVDILTVSVNLRIAADAGYTGASLARAGLTLTLPDASTVTFFIGGIEAGPGGRIRMQMTVSAGPVTTVENTGDTLSASETYDYRMTLEVSRQACALYVDGILIFTRKFAAPITVLSTLELSASTHNHVVASIDQAFLTGIAGLPNAGGTLDLVEIPVRQVLLPGATYGISYARGLKIAKPAIRAQAFHNAMKGKSL